jgi:hypothetical protein
MPGGIPVISADGSKPDSGIVCWRSLATGAGGEVVPADAY